MEVDEGGDGGGYDKTSHVLNQNINVYDKTYHVLNQNINVYISIQ